MQSDDGVSLIRIIVFESNEAYVAFSNIHEQPTFYPQKFMPLIDGDVNWVNDHWIELISQMQNNSLRRKLFFHMMNHWDPRSERGTPCITILIANYSRVEGICSLSLERLGLCAIHWKPQLQLGVFAY